MLQTEPLSGLRVRLHTLGLTGGRCSRTISQQNSLSYSKTLLPPLRSSCSWLHIRKYTSGLQMRFCHATGRTSCQRQLLCKGKTAFVPQSQTGQVGPACAHIARKSESTLRRTQLINLMNASTFWQAVSSCAFPFCSSPPFQVPYGDPDASTALLSTALARVSVCRTSITPFA